MAPSRRRIAINSSKKLTIATTEIESANPRCPPQNPKTPMFQLKNLKQKIMQTKELLDFYENFVSQSPLTPQQQEIMLDKLY